MRPCNLFKGAFSVEGMRKEITKQVERARAYSVNFRTAERFGLLHIVENRSSSGLSSITNRNKTNNFCET